MTSPTDVVIASAARTPVGAFNGALSTLPASELGTAAIRAALSSGDRTAVGRLVGQLEKCNPTERPATSPLLDGCWETLYASDTADWTRGAGRVRHLIESYCPGPNAYASVLQAGPRGNRWDDVRDGRGAYVQRARHRFGSSEVRATFTWLGGEAWDIEYVSRARLLLGIPFQQSEPCAEGVELPRRHCSDRLQQLHAAGSP